VARKKAQILGTPIDFHRSHEAPKNRQTRRPGLEPHRHLASRSTRFSQHGVMVGGVVGGRKSARRVAELSRPRPGIASLI